MALTKSTLKSRPVCKVRFKLNAVEVDGADKVFLVGTFNDWNEASHPMKKNKNGSFGLEVELPQGQEVQFRYRLDNGRWLNDADADAYVYCAYAGTDNSVLKL